MATQFLTTHSLRSLEDTKSAERLICISFSVLSVSSSAAGGEKLWVPFLCNVEGMNALTIGN